VHDVKDFSNITKFNFLKGQLLEQVKVRVKGIMATEDNYNLLFETLEDNYGDKTAVKNAHCVCSHYNGEATGNSFSFAHLL